ncbi:adenosylcobinamide-GDP ribazoletransferase [Thalassolituus oleivorans]|uniref:adenosylcobinamide-GDP ribazoletransferase n=1 Tax=Thalassolituus oleivorans TaxID=187493 RepID=UPI0023F179F9|nr:adenosylcobinamide-GDP ribazoletransferase [Thalassolituus oleivorans]
MILWWAFLTSLAFLTRLPLPRIQRYDESIAALSVIFYPLVGAIIGGLLCLFVGVLIGFYPHANSGLVAALVLTLWTYLSGGLHLDGLADSADAWVGGLGQRDKTLAIMKDPQSGPMGVIAIVLVLLIKWAALEALLQPMLSGTSWWPVFASIIIVPILARAVVIGVLATTPYVREAGLGKNLLAGVTPIRVWVTLIIVALLTVLLVPKSAILLLLVWLTVAAMARAAMLKRIQGCTGDTLGATIEIQEAILLVALALAI